MTHRIARLAVAGLLVIGSLSGSVSASIVLCGDGPFQEEPCPSGKVPRTLFPGKSKWTRIGKLDKDGPDLFLAPGHISTSGKYRLGLIKLAYKPRPQSLKDTFFYYLYDCAGKTIRGPYGLMHIGMEDDVDRGRISETRERPWEQEIGHPFIGPNVTPKVIAQVCAGPVSPGPSFAPFAELSARKSPPSREYSWQYVQPGDREDLLVNQLKECGTRSCKLGVLRKLCEIDQRKRQPDDRTTPPSCDEAANLSSKWRRGSR